MTQPHDAGTRTARWGYALICETNGSCHYEMARRPMAETLGKCSCSQAQPVAFAYLRVWPLPRYSLGERPAGRLGTPLALRSGPLEA